MTGTYPETPCFRSLEQQPAGSIQGISRRGPTTPAAAAATATTPPAAATTATTSE